MLTRNRRPHLVAEPTLTEDGRLICNTPEQWKEQRRAVYDREKGLCQGCRRDAPLHRRTLLNGSVRPAGEADHIQRRKLRDDGLRNLRWLCRWCHRKRHDGAKVVPRKG